LVRRLIWVEKLLCSNHNNPNINNILKQNRKFYSNVTDIN
jgi:hypothetical protein